jgi:hypothetical protein
MDTQARDTHEVRQVYVIERLDGDVWFPVQTLLNPALASTALAHVRQLWRQTSW